MLYRIQSKASVAFQTTTRFITPENYIHLLREVNIQVKYEVFERKKLQDAIDRFFQSFFFRFKVLHVA